MVHIKEYEVQGEIIPLLDDYSRIMQNCKIVSINENETIILVKKNGFLIIGESREDVVRNGRGLEGLFGDKLNPKTIELDIP